MLEGNEVEKKFDNGAGVALVDVDSQGKVVVSVTYNKEVDLDGYAKAKAAFSISAETDIFVIAEKLAAKTATGWDDAAVASLKSLLGIKSE